MRPAADVVIIGGGIQGISVAYHLARRGFTNVVLVEMDLLGSGSSGRSAAMLMLSMSRPETIALSRESYDEYMRFPVELDEEFAFKEIGSLALATRQAEAEVRQTFKCQRKEGVPVREVTPDEIGRLVPSLYVDDLVLGIECRLDGVIDPHAVMQAYARAARRAGVELNEGIQATGIQVDGDSVAAVETSAGRIQTRLVVNAAGARAREVGAWVGLDLPITNYKRHILVTEPFPEIPDDTPFVEDAEREWYFRKEGPGILMGMGREESTSYEPQVEREFQDELIQAAVRRVPILARARVLRGWAGLRPLTPDDLPILGFAPGVSGFLNCCGWGGHGVMHAPIGGRLTAELIADGRTSMDLAPYSLDRFAAGSRRW